MDDREVIIEAKKAFLIKSFLNYDRMIDGLEMHLPGETVSFPRPECSGENIQFLLSSGRSASTGSLDLPSRLLEKPISVDNGKGIFFGFRLKLLPSVSCYPDGSIRNSSRIGPTLWQPWCFVGKQTLVTPGSDQGLG